MLDLSKYKAYMRGQYIDFDEATVSVANIAYMYGLNIFSGIRGYWSEKRKQLYIFRLRDHYERMVRSCKIMGFKNFPKDYNYQKFEKAVIGLLKENKIKGHVYIRPSIFIDEIGLGPQLKSYYDNSDYKDSLSIFIHPFDNLPVEGIKCCVSSWRRVSDSSIPARAKIGGAYVNSTLVKTEALSRGYNEGIVLDSEGQVCEGSTENIFLVRNGKLITPGLCSDILEGITRDTVITVAQELGYQVEQRPIDRTELYVADEIFLTGTASGVKPVLYLDERLVGTGEIGKVAKTISERLQEIHFGQRKAHASWLTPVYTR